MREMVTRAFAAAVAAVNPLECVRKSLSMTPKAMHVRCDGSNPTTVVVPFDAPSTPIYIIAFGKAAAAMTAGAEQVIGSRLRAGIAIMPRLTEGAAALKSTAYEAGASNLPDRRSIEATKEIGPRLFCRANDSALPRTCCTPPRMVFDQHRAGKGKGWFSASTVTDAPRLQGITTWWEQVLRMLKSAEPDAVFLVLISGGGSALLSLPSGALSLSHKLTTIKELVARGASIQQLNAVRRALSIVKGGGLLEAINHRKSLSLILSDIVGDPLEFIASGPTMPPQQSSVRAASVIDELGARGSLAKQVIDLIENEKRRLVDDDSATVAVHAIVASNAIALEAAESSLESEGFSSTIASCTRVGGAADFGREVANAAIEWRNGARKAATLYGGETTVTLGVERGMGGRNQHAALAALLELAKRRAEWAGRYRISLLFAGTDGQDGPTDVAGAAVTSEDAADMSDEEYAEAEQALRLADSYNFWKGFRAGRCHFRPGLTGTNVMDITISTIETTQEYI